MSTFTCRLAVLAAVGCSLLAPAVASATSSAEAIATAKTKAVAYLETLQQTNGGFVSDWDLSALASAGVAAANVKKTGAETDARTRYRELVGNSTATKWPSEALVTEYERAALNGYAAGIDPARVSKTQNLIAQIAAFYQPASPGYYGPTANFNGTVFALLALENAKTTGGAQRVPQALLDKSIAVVRANEHTNGGWAWEKAEGNEAKLKGASEPDMTGAAMAALCGAGVKNSDSAVVAGEAYLKSLLTSATGAFTSEFGANTDSNAWAVQGLDACGIEPQGTEFTTAMGKTPIDFLISQQLTSGAFRYLTSGMTANEYASQDALRSLAGAGFTATPPTPTGGLEQWFAESGFSTSKTVKSTVTVIVNNESTALKVCSVTVAPAKTTTTLKVVLEAAEAAASTPAECVTGHKAEAGTEALTQINSFPASPSAMWELSVDGAAEAQAKLTSTIHLGDTIYLRFA